MKSYNRTPYWALALLLAAAVMLFDNTALAAECSNRYSGKDAGTGLIIRWGEGGFRDSRSPDGDVGGGQFALDIVPCQLPVSVTLSSESYTRSADPTENYEISSLYALNALYGAPLGGFERTDYFLAAGIGRLKVPDLGARVGSDLVNLEAGLHWRRFERFGFYGSLKYLHAQKKRGGRKVIDFDEAIFMLGLTYRFSW